MKLLARLSILICWTNLTIIRKSAATFQCRDSDYRYVAGDPDYNIEEIIAADVVEEDLTLVMAAKVAKKD